MYSGEQLGLSIYSDIAALERNREAITQQVRMLRSQLVMAEEQLRYNPNDPVLVADIFQLNNSISSLEKEAMKSARKSVSLQKKLDAEARRKQNKERTRNYRG